METYTMSCEYWYLDTPKLTMWSDFEEVGAIVEQFLKEDFSVYCPEFAEHSYRQFCPSMEKVLSEDAWKKIHEPLLKSASGVLILKMDRSRAQNRTELQRRVFEYGFAGKIVTIWHSSVISKVVNSIRNPEYEG